MVPGQYKLLLLVWSGTGLVKGLYACIYWKKINGDANQPTDQPTNRVNIGQSAFSKVRKWKKAEICNYHFMDGIYALCNIFWVERMKFIFIDCDTSSPFHKNSKKLSQYNTAWDSNFWDKEESSWQVPAFGNLFAKVDLLSVWLLNSAAARPN